ncbi:hypothetical protein SAMN04489841_1125 [Natrinema salaciae]|uniref:Uncharacterized protein n=1 Tax=Natrinema salaciae TaxID=1186196 RepID=A0A1H9CQJ0_9EURY|nr:hypothetical protein SAMN04489841_1125 [Natrinema salaciae]
MSVQTDHQRSSESRLRRELEDGRFVDVEITGSPENKKRVDVRVEGGRHWVLAVQNQTAGLIMTLNANGQRVDDEIPSWLEPLLRRIGLEGVET